MSFEVMVGAPEFEVVYAENSPFRVILQGPEVPGPPGADGVQSSDASVGDIRAMTQAAYDALPLKNPTTFYIIKDA